MFIVWICIIEFTLLLTQNKLSNVAVYDSNLRSHENQLSEASCIQSTTPYSTGDQNTII